MDTLTIGGISTLDSAQSRRELSAQFCEEDTSRKDWLVDEINRCIAADITTEPLLAVPGTPTALQLIAQGLDYDDLSEQMAQLLIEVAAGHRMQGHARELLRMVVERFAEGVTK